MFQAVFGALDWIVRVLIIGPGYIGFPLGVELVRRGHQVFSLSRRGDASGDLQAAGLNPLVGDIADPNSLKHLPPLQFDWVVNCVSSTHGGVEDYRKVYLAGMRNLVHWLAQSPPRKFVYTSSTGVYGQDDGSWVDESAVTEPPSETSRVLVEAEHVLLEAAREKLLPAVILRVAGIYGPGRSWWLRQMLAGEARIEGAGLRTLNMIHRDDVIGCIIAALEGGRPGEIYNAVDDEPVKQRDFLTWLAAKLNQPLPTAVSERTEVNRKRGVTNKQISNRKLREKLGYSFRYPTFREGYSAEID